jgi:hypothetical protein
MSEIHLQEVKTEQRACIRQALFNSNAIKNFLTGVRLYIGRRSRMSDFRRSSLQIIGPFDYYHLPILPSVVYTSFLITGLVPRAGKYIAKDDYTNVL